MAVDKSIYKDLLPGSIPESRKAFVTAQMEDMIRERTQTEMEEQYARAQANMARMDELVSDANNQLLADRLLDVRPTPEQIRTGLTPQNTAPTVNTETAKNTDIPESNPDLAREDATEFDNTPVTTEESGPSPELLRRAYRRKVILQNYNQVFDDLVAPGNPLNATPTNSAFDDIAGYMIDPPPGYFESLPNQPSEAALLR